MHHTTKFWRRAARIAALPLLASLAACGSGPPQATEGKWTFASSGPGKPYVFDGSFLFEGGQDGWFNPKLLLSDKRGCPLLADLKTVMPPPSHPDSFRATMHQELGPNGPISRVKLILVYQPDGVPPSSPEQTVFVEERVLDASVQPADPKTCSEKSPAETLAARKARLREKAKTDPDGADAEAISSMGRNELMATAINSAGFLCARVTNMYPNGSGIIVDCVEYRSGKGRVKYRVNPASGEVEQL